MIATAGHDMMLFLSICIVFGTLLAVCMSICLTTLIMHRREHKLKEEVEFSKLKLVQDEANIRNEAARLQLDEQRLKMLSVGSDADRTYVR